MESCVYSASLAPPLVLANAAAAALLAPGALTPVLADALAAAFLAIVTLPSMLAFAAAAALFAPAALPPVLADAAAAALLAPATLPNQDTAWPIDLSYARNGGGGHVCVHLPTWIGPPAGFGAGRSVGTPRGGPPARAGWSG